MASIAFLVLMSAFFSGSETSMMAINRYRLKHLVKEKNKSAKRVSKLLEKTDRLLGVILIGNNFTHTLSTALATVVAIRIWSDSAVLAVTVFMTIIMIIFALPFGFLQERSGGKYFKMFLGIILGISYQIINTMMRHLGTLNDWPPFLSSLIPSLIFLSIGVYLITKFERL